MESKFSQYYENPKQEGGSLTGEYLRELFDDFCKKIRDELSNAIIAFDVSLPMSVDDFTKWSETLFSLNFHKKIFFRIHFLPIFLGGRFLATLNTLILLLFQMAR